MIEKNINNLTLSIFLIGIIFLVISKINQEIKEKYYYTAYVRIYKDKNPKLYKTFVLIEILITIIIILSLLYLLYNYFI